jgi:hypothetical protein
MAPLKTEFQQGIEDRNKAITEEYIAMISEGSSKIEVMRYLLKKHKPGGSRNTIYTILRQIPGYRKGKGIEKNNRKDG